MTNFTDSDRALAFGGLFQGARLARDIARSGICDAAAFEASRESLFDFDPDSVAAVFGGTEGVALGLRILLEQIEKPARRDLEVSRYAVAVTHLADRLLKDPAAAEALASDLAALARRRASFELSDSTLHEQLGEIYQARVSPLGPRIMIKGEPLHLQNADNAARIRVALMAGIRAAVLWRQAGGAKWQLLLKRRAIVVEIRNLLDNIEQ